MLDAGLLNTEELIDFGGENALVHLTVLSLVLDFVSLKPGSVSTVGNYTTLVRP